MILQPNSATDNSEGFYNYATVNIEQRILIFGGVEKASSSVSLSRIVQFTNSESNRQGRLNSNKIFDLLSNFQTV